MRLRVGAELARIVDEPGHQRRGGARSADAEPAAAGTSRTKHPDGRVGIRDRGNIGGHPRIHVAEARADAVLISGLREIGAVARAALIPGGFLAELAAVRGHGPGASDGRAADSDNIGRGRRKFDAGIVTRGGEEHDIGLVLEMDVLVHLLGKFTAAIAHRDLPAPGCLDKLNGLVHGDIEIRETRACRLDEIDMGIRRHRMRHLDVESGFQRPSRIRGGLRAGGEDDGKIGRRKAELRGIGLQVG